MGAVYIEDGVCCLFVCISCRKNRISCKKGAEKNKFIRYTIKLVLYVSFRGW